MVSSREEKAVIPIDGTKKPTTLKNISFRAPSSGPASSIILICTFYYATWLCSPGRRNTHLPPIFSNKPWWKNPGTKKNGQLNRGQRKDGADTAKALDCASWGAVFLQAVGEDSKALTSLDSTKNYFVASKKHQGYKPYFDELLYEDPEINSLFYPDAPEKNWKDLPMIWTEGSLGVAMAYLKLDKIEQAVEVIEAMVALQDKEGGLPYATEDLRYQFSDNSSVAGTAWLVMVIAALEDENNLNLFWQR